ncbi:MAG: hypothetical protein CM15mP59_2430 [Flavobacteriaceae bacterium]|nr:MAG: hypothetical protein CM15mP59_2430 [Flavobacteriaceae bacterium]
MNPFAPVASVIIVSPLLGKMIEDDVTSTYIISNSIFLQGKETLAKPPKFRHAS